jgi:hypothetical protein
MPIQSCGHSVSARRGERNTEIDVYTPCLDTLQVERLEARQLNEVYVIPERRGIHSSASQLNLSRFITETPKSTHCMSRKVLTLSREVYECKPLPERQQLRDGVL